MDIVLRLLTVFADPPPPTITAFINKNNFVGARLTNINQLVGLLLPILYIGASLIFAGMLIWAGYLVITAGGEQEKVQQAQSTATYAVIGILIVVLAYLMVQLLSFVLGLNNSPL